MPEARIPRSGRGSWTCRPPSARCRRPAATPPGTVYVTDEPDAIAKKFRSAVTDSGSEVRRAPDKAGISNLIEILAAVRGVDARRRSRASSTGSGYGEFKTAVAEAVVDYLAPVRERYEALRADEAGARARPRRRRREGPARSPPRRWPTSARPWGWARSDPRRLTSSGAEARTVTLTYLELDLDVFAGPFDLLLTLILREEVDLLEVDLAEIVIAYIDHLERRGELDLEAATEFLVLIAALLELKSRLLLPGEEIEELELDPGEAAEELLARLLAAQRYRAAAEYLGSRARARAGLPLPLRAAALRAAHALRSPMPGRSTTRRSCRGRSHTLLGSRRRSMSATSRSSKVTVAERLAHLRALLLRGRFTFSEAVGDSRPGDGRGHPVRAARALQAGRGDLGAGRAVRRDHDQRLGPDACTRASGGARGAEADRVSATGVEEMTDAERLGELPRILESLLFLSARTGERRRAGRGRRRRGDEVRGCAASAARALRARWPRARAARAGRRLRAVQPSRRRGRRAPPVRQAAHAAADRAPRPRRWRSSPTCSRSPAPRSPASAASAPSRPPATLLERGLVEESGRSQFGAVLYRTTDLFLKLFGLQSIGEPAGDRGLRSLARARAGAARAAAARRRGPCRGGGDHRQPGRHRSPDLEASAVPDFEGHHEAADEAAARALAGPADEDDPVGED